MNELVAFFKKGESLTQIPARKIAFQSLQEKGLSLKAQQLAIGDSLLALQKEYSTEVQKNLATVTESLTLLGTLAYQADNTRALLTLTETWSRVIHSTAFLGRFAESGRMEDGETVRGSINALQTPLAVLEDLFHSEEGKKISAELLRAQKALLAAAETMIRHAAVMQRSLIVMREIETEITKSFEVVSAETGSGMLEIGDLLNQEGTSVKNFMVALSFTAFGREQPLPCSLLSGLSACLRIYQPLPQP